MTTQKDTLDFKPISDQQRARDDFHEFLASREPLTFTDRYKLFIEYAPPGTSLHLGTIKREVCPCNSCSDFQDCAARCERYLAWHFG